MLAYYVAQLVGARHVGLGLDAVFDQASMDASLSGNTGLWPPQYGYRPGIAFYQPEQLPELAEILLSRSWSEADVRGVLGENLLRVASEVWAKPEPLA